MRLPSIPRSRAGASLKRDLAGLSDPRGPRHSPVPGRGLIEATSEASVPRRQTSPIPRSRAGASLKLNDVPPDECRLRFHSPVPGRGLIEAPRHTRASSRRSRPIPRSRAGASLKQPSDDPECVRIGAIPRSRAGASLKLQHLEPGNQHRDRAIPRSRAGASLKRRYAHASEDSRSCSPPGQACDFGRGHPRQSQSTPPGQGPSGNRLFCRVAAMGRGWNVICRTPGAGPVRGARSIPITNAELRGFDVEPHLFERQVIGQRHHRLPHASE